MHGQTDKSNIKTFKRQKETWKFRILQALQPNKAKPLNLQTSQPLFAFTLAEVLITLGIIGVVAAITIPTLISKYKRVQISSGLKKTYSMLNALNTKAITENGPLTDWGFTGDSTWTGMVNIYANILAPHLQISKYCGATNSANECWAYGYNIDGTSGSATPNNYCVYAMLSDGTSIAFRDSSVLGTPRYTINFYVDVNGLKSPNKWGLDRFIFLATYINTGGDTVYNNKMLPGGILAPTITRDACWTSAGTGIATYPAGSGKSCALTIISKDNWEIATDNPYW